MVLKKIRQSIRDKRSELKTVHPIKRFLFWASISIATTVILGIFSIFMMVAVLSIGLPDVTDLDALTAAQSTEIYDRNGELLYTIHGEENRQYVPYNEISKNIINATVAIEDDQFWTHSGFDLPGITKAALHSVFGFGKARGGSTITQQYVKNTFLSPEQTYTRKIKELILAVRVEQHYDKEQIMELYLNKIPYSNNAYGIEKASKIYFDKPAKDLTIAESAILAGIPKAPTYYNPLRENKYSHLNREFTTEEAARIKSASDLNDEDIVFGLIGKYNSLNPTVAEENTDEETTDGDVVEDETPTEFVPPENSIYIKGRSDLVLSRMLDLEYITQAEHDAAVIEIQTKKFGKFKDPIKHPHFVFYVKAQLEEKYGAEIVEQGGLKVYTTIDSKIQTEAEEMLSKRVESNLANYNAENASLVAINPNNGHIISMIGSADFFNDEIEGKVNVSTRSRQPGSSFKPFTYAQAFYNGYGPGSVIYDVKTNIGVDTPQNYDGSFRGPMSIRAALAQSRNIPAVKAYFLAGEQKPIVELATRMGITTLNKNADYGYPLALGAGEVKLIDMVTAYGVFANGGIKVKPVSILKVENANGDVIEEWTENDIPKEEVLDPQIAFLINDILSDTSYRLGPNLTADGHINAAKTGTSTDKNKKLGGEVRPRDTWTIGYTPNLVAGVWVGNNKPSEKPLNFNASGYQAAAPIWKGYMKIALRDEPNAPFKVPEGIKEVSISKISGLLPSDQTPDNMIVSEKFASFAIPTDVDDRFVTYEIDPISGKIIGEGCLKELKETKSFVHHKPIEPRSNWEAGVNQWISIMKEKGEIAEGVIFSAPPTETCGAPSAEELKNLPSIKIVSPLTLSEIDIGKLNVAIEIDANNGVHKVDFYLGEKFQFTNAEEPYHGTLRVSHTYSPGSKILIRVQLFDKEGYSAESIIEVKIAGEDIKEEDKKDPIDKPNDPVDPETENPDDNDTNN